DRAHLRDPRSARHLARGRRHPAQARAPRRRARPGERQARDPGRVGDTARGVAARARADDPGDNLAAGLTATDPGLPFASVVTGGGPWRSAIVTLTLHLPKAERARARRIEVEAALRRSTRPSTCSTRGSTTW